MATEYNIILAKCKKDRGHTRCHSVIPLNPRWWRIGFDDYEGFYEEYQGKLVYRMDIYGIHYDESKLDMWAFKIESGKLPMKLFAIWSVIFLDHGFFVVPKSKKIGDLRFLEDTFPMYEQFFEIYGKGILEEEDGI